MLLIGNYAKNYTHLDQVLTLIACASSPSQWATGVTVNGATITMLPSPNPQTLGYCTNQLYDFVVTAVNNNIIRISGGKHQGVPPTVSCYKRCDNSFMGKQCKLSPPIGSSMIACM